MANEEIKISVICIAYNQAPYIRKALDSMVCQKVNIPFEIVVHDDCSTDGTTEIIKEYEKKYQNLIRVFYEEKNQYSIGNDIFVNCSLPKCRGKFVAICEGDDYWTDCNKLQKQYEVLEQYPEIDMCACRASEVSGDDEIEIQEIRPKKENIILTPEEVILGGGRYLATATLFFRKSLFDSCMEFEKIMCFDYTYQIKGSLKGGIYYIDENMAAYRNNTAGSWSERVEKDEGKHSEHIEKEKALLVMLDKETEGKYHEVIMARLKAYTPFYEQLQIHEEELLHKLEQSPDGFYLWGMGMRGEAFLKFCSCHGGALRGVCDRKNNNIGNKTKYGYEIISTDDVMKKAKCIIASNNIIAEALNNQGYKGMIVNIQKYMPLS